MAQWTLDDALKLIRGLQEPTRKYGYHITLGGSVLNDGKSNKDLDLYFQPCAGEYNKGEDLVKWLVSIWGEPQTLKKEYDTPDPDEGRFLSSRTLTTKDPMKFNLKQIYLRALKFGRGPDRIDVFIGWDPASRSTSNRVEASAPPQPTTVGTWLEMEDTPPAATQAGHIYVAGDTAQERFMNQRITLRSPEAQRAIDQGAAINRAIFSGGTQAVPQTVYQRWVDQFDARRGTAAVSLDVETTPAVDVE